MWGVNVCYFVVNSHGNFCTKFQICSLLQCLFLFLVLGNKEHRYSHVPLISSLWKRQFSICVSHPSPSQLHCSQLLLVQRHLCQSQFIHMLCVIPVDEISTKVTNGFSWDIWLKKYIYIINQNSWTELPLLLLLGDRHPWLVKHLCPLTCWHAVHHPTTIDCMLFSIARHVLKHAHQEMNFPLEYREVSCTFMKNMLKNSNHLNKLDHLCLRDWVNAELVLIVVMNYGRFILVHVI